MFFFFFFFFFFLFFRAAQMMNFILQQEIPLSEPVIMAGDFNVDLHSHTSEGDNLFNVK